MVPSELRALAGSSGSMDLTNPQSLNRYSYVLNNPLSFRDPLGLECVWDDGSYDSLEDADTGNWGGCSSAGGTWFDHEWFAGQGLGDWSPNPNSNLAGLVNTSQNGTPDATVYGNVGDLVDSLFNQMHQNYIDRMNALNAVPTPEQYIQAIANAAPTVCGGGVFAYGGRTREVHSG